MERPEYGRLCNCGLQYLKYVWSDEENRQVITCTKCGKPADYSRKQKKEREYRVPKGYQNWKAGYGFRHNPNENGVRLYSCQL